MKKITRTFRKPANLVERFDQAAEETGIDRTEVIVQSIQKFVERVEAGKLWNTDKLVIVEWLYAPELGKCALHNQALIDEEGNNTNRKHSSLQVLNCERTAVIDGKKVRYDIENAYADIDFINKKCKVTYFVRWIGGLVEKRSAEFAISWKTEERDVEMAIEVFPV